MEFAKLDCFCVGGRIPHDEEGDRDCRLGRDYDEFARGERHYVTYVAVYNGNWPDCLISLAIRIMVTVRD